MLVIDSRRAVRPADRPPRGELGVRAELMSWRSAERSASAGLPGAHPDGRPLSVRELGAGLLPGAPAPGDTGPGHLLRMQPMALLEGGEAGPAGSSGEYGGRGCTAGRARSFRAARAERTLDDPGTGSCARRRLCGHGLESDCPCRRDGERRRAASTACSSTRRSRIRDRGRALLENFLYGGLCGCRGGWRMSDYAGRLMRALSRGAGGPERAHGLSGGGLLVTVVLERAAPGRLTCAWTTASA